jgi:hypothetical protein
LRLDDPTEAKPGTGSTLPPGRARSPGPPHRTV